MQKFKRQSIDYILTDMLPEEKGNHFTHTYLYKYLEDNSKQLNRVFEIVREKDVHFDSDWHSAPLNFKIKKKHMGFRRMSYINPIGLIQSLAFVELYSDEMINFFKNKESFSMRYHNYTNELIYKTVDKKRLVYANSLEEKKQLQIMLESSGDFFKLEPFKRITEYLSSNKHLRAKEQFKYLLKMDIQNCFGSIYTHSYKWTISSKNYDSKSLSKSNSLQKNIDTFLQNLNGSKTNGIVVGPELSRMLAEYLLVNVDEKLINILYSEGFIKGQDYTIHRYVDDYYMFTNDLKVQQLIQREIKELLIEFQLTVNESKIELVDNETVNTNNWIHEIEELTNSVVEFIDPSIGIKDIFEIYTNLLIVEGLPVNEKKVMHKLNGNQFVKNENKSSRISYTEFKSKTLWLLSKSNEPTLISSYLLTVILKRIESLSDMRLSSKTISILISYTMFLYTLNIDYKATQKIIRIFSLLLNSGVENTKERIANEIEKNIKHLSNSYVSDWRDLLLFLSSYDMKVSKESIGTLFSSVLEEGNPVNIASVLIAVDSSFVVEKSRIRMRIEEEIRHNMEKINWKSFFEDPLSWWVFIFYSYPNLNKNLKKELTKRIREMRKERVRQSNQEARKKELSKKIELNKMEIHRVCQLKKSATVKESERIDLKIATLNTRKSRLMSCDRLIRKYISNKKMKADLLKTELLILEFLLNEEKHFIEWDFERESFFEKYYFYTRKRTVFNPKEESINSYF